MKSLIIQILVTLLFLVSSFIAGSFFTGCSSFEPVQIKGELSECNDWFTVMKFYSGQKSVDTMILTAYNKCQQARKDKHKDKIIELNKQLDCIKIFVRTKQYSEISSCFRTGPTN